MIADLRRLAARFLNHHAPTGVVHFRCHLSPPIGRPAVLHWPGMRTLAVIALCGFCLVNVGCVADGVMLQPPVQGEWSNFHDNKDQVTMDARPSADQPAAEKAESQK